MNYVTSKFKLLTVSSRLWNLIKTELFLRERIFSSTKLISPHLNLDVEELDVTGDSSEDDVVEVDAYKIITENNTLTAHKSDCDVSNIGE